MTMINVRNWEKITLKAFQGRNINMGILDMVKRW